MCSKYVNHSKLKSRHNWTGLCNWVVTSWLSPLDKLKIQMQLNLAYSSTFMVQLKSRFCEMTLYFIAKKYHLPKSKPTYCHIHITNIGCEWKMHIALIPIFFGSKGSPPIPYFHKHLWEVNAYQLNKPICGLLKLSTAIMRRAINDLPMPGSSI